MEGLSLREFGGGCKKHLHITTYMNVSWIPCPLLPPACTVSTWHYAECSERCSERSCACASYTLHRVT